MSMHCILVRASVAGSSGMTVRYVGTQLVQPRLSPLTLFQSSASPALHAELGAFLLLSLPYRLIDGQFVSQLFGCPVSCVVV